MAEDKKFVEAITSMDVDFAQWYTDVVKKAELMGYSSVKGCMIFKPAGYAIWENIKAELDKRFNVVNSNKITKKARIEATILNNLTPISKSEICSILPDVSATTVEVVLASMVKDGTIIKIGNGRNTKYIKNNVKLTLIFKGVLIIILLKEKIINGIKEV